MAKKNRVNLKAGIAATFYNNILGLIKGTTSRDAFNDQADSNLNIISDADQPGGYLAIDMAGKVISGPILAGLMAEASLNVTGLTTIDLAGITAPIVNLVSTNATEVIDNVTNFLNPSRVTFRAEAGLDITFNDKAINGGNLRLAGPEMPIYGTNGGELRLETRAGSADLWQDKYTNEFNA